MNDVDLADRIGSELDAARVGDADGVTALVMDIVLLVLVEYEKQVREQVAEEILADVAVMFAARVGANMWEAAYRAARVARGEP